MIIKINHFRGDLSDVSAKTANTVRDHSQVDVTQLLVCLTYVTCSASFQPKYRVGHPENYLFSLSKKNLFRIKVSKKIFNFILQKEELVTCVVKDCRVLGHA